VIYIPAAFAFAGITEFPELATRWRVVQVDLQGHGRTADIDRPLNFDQHAEDVAALMRHLDIERAHLFGWSYGGLVAMLIALRRPELVGRVATYGTLFGPPQDGIRPDKLGPPVEQTPDGLAHRFARDHYKRVAPDPDHWPVIWQKVVDLTPDGFYPRAARVDATPRPDSAGRQRLHSAGACAACLRGHPNAELAVIPDATHFLLYDAPGSWSRSLRSSSPRRGASAVRHNCDRLSSGKTR